MLEVTTTQVADATKKLACPACPLHYNCNKYALICDFVKNNLFFGASLLCTLERAEDVIQSKQRELLKNKSSCTMEKIKTLYKDFLPELNNALAAFYKYECDKASDYHKQEIICYLAESLEYYGLLQYFDFVYCRDIEITRDILIKQFDFLMAKNEDKNFSETKNK